MRELILVALVASALVSLAGEAKAQPTTGEVTGIVKLDGVAQNGVTVECIDSRTSGAYPSDVTPIPGGAAGSYLCTAVLAGDVRLAGNGQEAPTNCPSQVQNGTTITCNANISTASGCDQPTVTITGSMLPPILLAPFAARRRRLGRARRAARPRRSGTERRR